MPAYAARQVGTPNHQILKLARSVLLNEAAALNKLAEQVDESFSHAVQLVLDTRGSVIVTGIGKAGLIGQKITATLASTGTPSHFLHPAEAMHGDLGRVQSQDLVLVLSFSGETEEITRLLPSLAVEECSIIAMTSRKTSTLGQAADCVVELGTLQEADPLRLAPSTSTTALLALGDALALAAAQQRKFAAEDFAKFHPGGSLGRKLAKVDDFMRPVDACRVSHASETVRQVLVDVGRPGRRSGAIMLVDDHSRLCGVFTDSDLARLFEDHRETALDEPISRVMCGAPTTITEGSLLSQAIERLASHKISELPVVDSRGCPIGLIDITDVVTTPSPTQDDHDAFLLRLFPDTIDARRQRS